MPVRHVQASTEACQTIECNLSFQICVILCRRLGSRNDLSSVNKHEKHYPMCKKCMQKQMKTMQHTQHKKCNQINKCQQVHKED